MGSQPIILPNKPIVSFLAGLYFRRNGPHVGSRWGTDNDHLQPLLMWCAHITSRYRWCALLWQVMCVIVEGDVRYRGRRWALLWQSDVRYYGRWWALLWKVMCVIVAGDGRYCGKWSTITPDVSGRLHVLSAGLMPAVSGSLHVQLAGLMTDVSGRQYVRVTGLVTEHDAYVKDGRVWWRNAQSWFMSAVAGHESQKLGKCGNGAFVLSVSN